MSVRLYFHKASRTLWLVVREKPLTLVRGTRDRRPTPATLARDYEVFQ